MVIEKLDGLAGRISTLEQKTSVLINNNPLLTGLGGASSRMGVVVRAQAGLGPAVSGSAYVPETPPLNAGIVPLSVEPPVAGLGSTVPPTWKPGE
jgi:hypothetical protein